jgi:hypothetical protein
MTTTELHETLETLIDALRAHAAMMAADPPAEQAIPAITAVREAAIAYGDAVGEVAGWGNVFADLYDEEIELDEDDE